jgi:integrase
MAQEWMNRWGTWCRPTSTAGVFERRDGGFLVRRRVTSATTGMLVEIKKVLAEATLGAAILWLEMEEKRIRSGGAATTPAQRMRFGAYAADLLERKIAARDLRSKASQQKWRYALEHLVGGTYDENEELIIDGFGDMFLDAIDVCHVERWRAQCGLAVTAGEYDPTTINESWIPILKGVMKQAKRELKLSFDATEGLRKLDEGEHPDFTEEEPNALEPTETVLFLEELRAAYPQHYGMAVLGFVTGLRPSALRPLRRTGTDRDVLWDQNAILIRRSQTIGEPIEKTKTGLRQRIAVPREVMDVLRWHVETQLSTAEQRDSDLLFPSVTGGFRTNTVLRKPFSEVATALGLTAKVTAKAMRRTFNDVARVAGIRDLVIRSISGHATEEMQRRYSTVAGSEQAEALDKVYGLLSRREPPPEPSPEERAVAEPVPGGGHPLH